MNDPDSSSGVISLSHAWFALGHRVALIAGAGTALVAVLRHIPVRVASLRGALVWLSVVLVTRVGRALLDGAAERAKREAQAAATGEVMESDG